MINLQTLYQQLIEGEELALAARSEILESLYKRKSDLQRDIETHVENREIAMNRLSALKDALASFPFEGKR